MSEAEALWQYFDQYFKSKFDHDTLLDKFTTPFIQLTYIKNDAGMTPVISSSSFYAKNPKESVRYTQSVPKLLAIANVLTAKYISQRPETVQEVEDDGGFVGGVVIDNKDILIVTVVADPADARFLCHTLTLAIEILKS